MLNMLILIAILALYIDFKNQCMGKAEGSISWVELSTITVLLMNYFRDSYIFYWVQIGFFVRCGTSLSSIVT